MKTSRGLLWIVCILLAAPPVWLYGQISRQERLKQQQEALQWQVIRPVVRGSRAAVAAGTPLVTEAAMRMLHGGGNAVDAGVASLYAGAVSEFSHFGFGGEAPILIRTPEGAERWSLILGRALAEILADDALYSVLDGVVVE